MAMVEIGRPDDGGFSVCAVRFSYMIDAILEVGVRHLGEELSPLGHIFHCLHFCWFQIGITCLECESVNVADGTIELAISGSHCLARVVQPHANLSYLCGNVERRKQIVVGLALAVTEMPHLIIIEFHMLVAQSDTDVEATELLRNLHESRYIAFVHLVICIRNFGDIGCKEISGAGVCVFLANLYLSFPQRATNHKFLCEHTVVIGGFCAYTTIISSLAEFVAQRNFPVFVPKVICIEINGKLAYPSVVIQVGIVSRQRCGFIVDI